MTKQIKPKTKKRLKEGDKKGWSGDDVKVSVTVVEVCGLGFYLLCAFLKNSFYIMEKIYYSAKKGKNTTKVKGNVTWVNNAFHILKMYFQVLEQKKLKEKTHKQC